MKLFQVKLDSMRKLKRKTFAYRVDVYSIVYNADLFV